MSQAAIAQPQDLENTLYLYLKDGRVTIQMFPQQAPKHVERIKELTREGYYNGKLWHRVIEGFMAQTGSPNGDGIGGSTKPDLQAEFNQMSHIRGVVSMARTMAPNSANAQFFIMLANNPGLDGQYTVWGQVTEGMELVDNIKKGNPAQNGTVTNPDTIVKMTIAADEASPAATK
ncbi:MAG: peptidylprolyl isomerase [Proteobacteria bacterium]|nr:peptidylprolyl isomerase [Pseudomonadota bacterium]NBX86702.1 peptidylprolyl isomerase [Pseudomonadota bacterium]